MKQKLQKYLDDCIKLRIPPFFEIVLSSLRRFVSRTKRFRPLDYACLSVGLLQSPAADRTVHCSRLYGPLPKTIVTVRTKRLNSPHDKA